MSRKLSALYVISLPVLFLLSVFYALTAVEEVRYRLHPSPAEAAETLTAQPTVRETPTPVLDEETAEEEVAAPVGTATPMPLILPPPTRPPGTLFVPGSGPYRLYPAPDAPPPGQDWLLFEYEDQAIAHLRTGARIAAFCYFRHATPTPPPAGYPGGAYRSGPRGEFLVVPLFYIDEINAVHIVSTVGESEKYQLLANVLPYLETSSFNPVLYCAEKGK